MSAFLKLEPFNNGNLLEGIFEYQNVLIKEYQKRGLLPIWEKFDYTSKEGQLFLKSLVQNVLEELAEADEVADRLVLLATNPELPGLDSGLFDKYAEELADAMHFFIELLIYSGISAEDVVKYYEVLFQDNTLPLFSTDGLICSQRMGKHLNNFVNTDVNQIKWESKKVITLEEYERSYRPGSHQHPVLDVMLKKYLWDVTKTLNLATNYLKNRRWVQGEKSYVNIHDFQRKLMEAFTILAAYFDAIGWEEKGIYHHYEKKNFINQTRIIEKY